MSDGLDFASVTLSYGARAIVRDVSLRVAPGELVGLVGPNGAGKTTLLRGVTGHATVSAGEIRVGGRRAEDLGPAERARMVGVLPQAVSVDAPFGGADFVAMGRHAHLGRFGAFGERDREIVEAAMVRTDTESLADQEVTAVSGGELQRLVLAQALAQDPTVLLLDEPTNHLDINHRLQVLDLCRGLAREGMAVLGVFHDLDLAARYSDRVAIVSDGRLVEDGPPGDVLRPDVLRDVFRVRAVVGTDIATGSATVTALLRDEDVRDADRGRVVVIGGSGSGAWLVSTLFRAGWGVSLAAVSAGDTDLEVAKALGVPAVELAPFGEMIDADEAAVLGDVEAADAVVVAQTPFGRANLGNLRAAVAGARELILVGEMCEARDFADGDAQRLWGEALRRGARVAMDESEAVDMLRSVRT